MTRRFTETEKWNDVWFRKLSPEAKTLFEYLRDNCDIAGFWEIDFEVASLKTGIPLKQNEQELLDNCKTHYKDIETVVQELSKSCFRNEKYIWLKNFIFYQGNLPLGKDCNVNIAILKSINSHNGLRDKVLEYLRQQEIEKNLTTVSQGLSNPSGKGKGKGKGKGNKGVQGENPDHQVCLIDKERAYGNGFTVRSKNGKNLMFNLCPDCKKIYCELVKSEKIKTGSTSLQEIENKIQTRKASA